MVCDFGLVVGLFVGFLLAGCDLCSCLGLVSCEFFALVDWFVLVVGVLWIACGQLLYVLFVSGLLVSG